MEMPRNILYYILIVAMLSVFCECNGAQQTNDISCEGNGHIRIRTTADIKSVASNCSNGTKIVNVPNDNKTVIVDHCPLNQHVRILMYNVSSEKVGHSTILNKPETAAIVVMCDGTGLKVQTSLNNNAASFKPVTVNYQEPLTMKVFDKSDNSKTVGLTKIIVGGSYTLQINSTDDLTIHVQSCTASSSGDGTEEVQLYENGTYIKENGVFQGHFNETTSTMALIDMTGFRFVGKDTVVITCTVDVSTPPTTPTPTTTTTTTVPTSTTTTTVPTSTTTTTVPTSTKTTTVLIPPQTSGTTPIGRRKRRNAFQEEHAKNLAVSTSLRVESYYASTNGGKGMGGNGDRCMWIASILLVKYSLRWF